MPLRLIHHRGFTSTSVLPVSQEHGENDSGSQRSRTVLQHTEEMGKKTRKRRRRVAEGKNSYQLNSYSTSQLELPYAKNGTAAHVLQKSTLYCVIWVSLMPFNLPAAIFAFWITSFVLLQILLVWESVYSTALTWKKGLKTYRLRKNSL